MMTVHEVSRLTGVTIRTLHYYDEIGLLRPKAVTEAGYRMYDEASLERLIGFAKQLKQTGRKTMDFQAFDTQKIDAYTKEAKERWGDSDAYREFEQKTKGYSKEKIQGLGVELMALFAEFGAMRDKAPEASEVKAQVKKLQDFITAHYYTCSNQILAGLGEMYAAGGDMTDNIDAVGGTGTAAFAAEAIRHFVKQG